MSNLVIHPDHYNQADRKECWEEMIDIFGPEAVAIFDILSAYKYQYRAGLKDGNPEEQDKAKIENYVHHSANLIALNEKMTAARKVYKTFMGVKEDDND